ncbi:MAG: hypothetical protein CYPHOPRED_003074 [Cyphobasidiales sp. Tagirdzhanova-0007]|nr:MAG: hypothetical protein CYPHOPRED_003074 [Cyphobasidiales sp. Tagirdzhanova-0007]
MTTTSSVQSSVAINVENVQPLHHPEHSAVVSKANLAQGHSEMGGKALLAKKMAASGYVVVASRGRWRCTATRAWSLTENLPFDNLRRQSFYSPTDTMVSPCTAKLHLAKKKHFNKGKPLALSSSFATSANNPLSPVSQNVPLTKEGFLHPSHAEQAQFTLAHQGHEEPSQAPDHSHETEEVEMEM